MEAGMDTGNFRGFDTGICEQGILTIRFNRPEKLNGLDQWIKRDLVETLTQAQMDDGVRVIVFTGSGRAFCAGDDLGGNAQDRESNLPDIPAGHRTPIGTYDGLRMLSQPVAATVRAVDKLTIAAINGIAIQSGFSLALACDFRIASDSARMGSATLRFGLLPDEGGQYLLVQLLGVAGAMDFLMRKRIVDAPEALALGLVHEVVGADELDSRASVLALELAEGPQVSMRLLKRSIYNAGEMTFAHALDEIASKTAISDHHADAREGVAAFREKRAPRFNGWLERAE